MLAAPDLANSVTSFCTIFAGISTLLLTFLMGAQPTRWLRVYACIFITGIPTLGWHGWATEFWRISDVGTNLLLAYMLQLAVLGDFYSPTVRRVVTVGSGVINGLAVAWMFVESYSGEVRNAVSFGDFGGFQPGELILILDAVSVVMLFAFARDEIPARARPLLTVVTMAFVVGLGLATAAGTTVHLRVISFHALWHVVGAFGFIFLWAFNHVRFVDN